VGCLGRVAAPAADDQRAVGAATGGDLADVVGGEVGGGVGGMAFPPGAPVPDQGPVVGHHLAAAAPLGCVVVEVGSALSLDLAAALFLEGPAAWAPALAADDAAASDAGAS
jgi:hypothetical protein